MISINIKQQPIKCIFIVKKIGLIQSWLKSKLLNLIFTINSIKYLMMNHNTLTFTQYSIYQVLPQKEWENAIAMLTLHYFAVNREATLGHIHTYWIITLTRHMTASILVIPTPAWRQIIPIPINQKMNIIRLILSN